MVVDVFFVVVVVFYKKTLGIKSCVFCSCRIAVAHRTMFQRGEVHNKPTGFWGMIKSVTTSVAGSESILHLHAGTCLGRQLQVFISFERKSLR